MRLQLLIDISQKKDSFSQYETKNFLLTILDKFGSSSNFSKLIIEALVQKILENTSKNSLKAFNSWNNYLDLEKNIQKIKSKTLERTLKFYSKDPSCTINKILFAINTYVSIIMKLIGLNIVIDGKFLVDETCVYNPMTNLMFQEADMREMFFQLEKGDIFSQNGIYNFIDGTEIFSWYLNEWDEHLEKLLFSCFIEILSNKIKLVNREEKGSFDIFGKFYLDLIPTTIRKMSGEVYTPLWLADFIVNNINFHLNLNTRILDPSCGSGIFLIQIIDRLENSLQNTSSKNKLLPFIQENIIGFDINPLAVLMARTSLLYMISNMWTTNTNFIIPVFLTNSLYITMLGKQKEFIEIYNKPEQYFEKILSLNKDSYFSKQILALYDLFSYKVSDTIYSKNTAKMLYFNILAPFSQKKFDTIIGNPPWVNWEFLSDIQKVEYSKIYTHFNLQADLHWDAKLGMGKYDLSAMFIYIVIKNFLKMYGNLLFIVPASLLKGNASAGFRKFEYNNTDNNSPMNSIVPIKLLEIHDLSSFQPFPLTNTKTMILSLKKGLKTKYPLDYTEWYKYGNIDPFCSWNNAKSEFMLTKARCAPILEKNLSSCLLVAKNDENLLYLQKTVFHTGIYRAYEGSNTEGFNAAFWIKNLADIKDNNELLTFENNNSRQKHMVELTKKYSIEKELIYPLIRSNNIRKWHYSLDTYIIYLPKYDEEIIINEEKFEKTYPYAYEYLCQLKKGLENRIGYKKKSHKYPFYIFYGKKEMKCPIKVCWTRMSIVSAVIITEIDHPFLGKKPAIPQETVGFIPIKDLLEAHYLCAVINSELFTKYISSFRISGTKSFASPEIFDKINIPHYDKKQVLHQKLASLSLEAHTLADKNLNTSDIQTKINYLVIELFDTL